MDSLLRPSLGAFVAAPDPGGFFMAPRTRDLSTRFYSSWCHAQWWFRWVSLYAPGRVRIAEFVALMIRLFNRPERGVIRASYRGAGLDNDTWEPLRRTSRTIRDQVTLALTPKMTVRKRGEAAKRVHFIYQVVNGTLINELLNPWHIYTIDDSRLETELNALVLEYLSD